MSSPAPERNPSFTVFLLRNHSGRAEDVAVPPPDWVNTPCALGYGSRFLHASMAFSCAPLLQMADLVLTSRIGLEVFCSWRFAIRREDRLSVFYATPSGPPPHNPGPSRSVPFILYGGEPLRSFHSYPSPPCAAGLPAIFDAGIPSSPVAGHRGGLPRGFWRASFPSPRVSCLPAVCCLKLRLRLRAAHCSWPRCGGTHPRPHFFVFPPELRLFPAPTATVFVLAVGPSV